MVYSDSPETLYHKKDIWGVENRKYSAPHYRLLKSARIVNNLAGEGERTLLDVGCGPGTLRTILRPNIRYHGIDISIPEPAPNLIEKDILEAPIDFEGKRFDIVIAQDFSNTWANTRRRSSPRSPRSSIPGGFLRDLLRKL